MVTIIDIPDELFASFIDYLPYWDRNDYIGRGAIASLYLACPTLVAPKMVLSSMFAAYPHGYDFDWSVDWTVLFAARREYRDLAESLGLGGIKTCATLVVDTPTAVSRIALAWHIGIDEVVLSTSYVCTSPQQRRNKVPKDVYASFADDFFGIFREWAALQNVFVPLGSSACTVVVIRIKLCPSWKCQHTLNDLLAIEDWRLRKGGKIFYREEDQINGKENGWETQRWRFEHLLKK